jgi:exosortase
MSLASPPAAQAGALRATDGRRLWLEAGAVVVLFAGLYAGVFADLVRAWLDSDIYRHGFLVPFVALYLVWIRREALRAIPVAPSWAVGLPFVCAAGAMLLAGRAGSAAIAEEVSLLVMLPGLVALLLGTGWLRALALPIGYLFFMVPVLADGTDWVHWPFQLLAANLGVWLLQVFGFPAFQQGVLIELPGVTLEVAEACSGIRFMISIVAVGIPLAYLTQRGWSRRVGLVLFAVGVGVLANGFRVALIGVWAFYGGEVLKGPMHVFQAMFVAWIGYVALFAAALWLRREGRA